MNKEKKLREALAIDEHIELIKEHNCCQNGARAIQQYMYLLEKENTNLKQALVDIREYVNSMKHLEGWIDIDGYAKREQDILQIIDSALGDDE